MARKTGVPDEARILAHLRHSRGGPLKALELAKGLKVPTRDYKAFKAELQSLESAGRIYRVKGQRYAVPEKINLLVGRLSITRNGDGFVVPEGPERDVFVPEPSLDTAMDGDQVVVRIERPPSRGRAPTGRVIKVLERAHASIVGTFDPRGRFATVFPRDPRVGRPVLIPPGEEGGATSGDVVVARITSYGTNRMNPAGQVERVLGKASDPGVDILSVIYGHGLPMEFPRKVEAAARSAAERQDPSGSDRVDRTNLAVFTIDPEDAKDHDDALSIEALPNGLWEVGIHIADVSFYVEEGDPLDAEALARGTSVYLVDRTIPMMPEALSADACSIRPHVDRLAVSVFASVDGQGRLAAHRFERTIIRSRHKLSYEVAQEVLDGARSVDPGTDEALRQLDEVARQLRTHREARGSLDFDLPEARVVLGGRGEPLDIRPVTRLDSHRLVEDFMLLANEIVAKEASERRLPVLYRVHDGPPPDRIEELRRFLSSMGAKLPKKGVAPKDLQAVLRQMKGTPKEGLVSRVVLRSMSRALYDVRNRGHFGLAAEWYAHFTSPIRRYPDLWTHRVLIRCLIERRDIPPSWGGEALERVASVASQRERLAEQAERESIDLKKVEYMNRHLGEDFSGTISGVTSFGFFVLLDDVYVDGLVHVSSLEDDFYVYQERSYRLVGERTRRIFRLGDRVRVRVSRVDKEERRIDFVYISAAETNV